MTGDGDGALLCTLSDIPDGGAKSFWFGEGTARRGIVLLRRGRRVFAYENSCPHRGTPLNFLGDRFLDREGRRILCATHGALFRIADGVCLSGPCTGARLTPLRTIRRGEEIRLEKGFSVLPQ